MPGLPLGQKLSIDCHVFRGSSLTRRAARTVVDVLMLTYVKSEKPHCTVALHD